jgi:phenylpropionate dioxygenase-like ring-hydroxylating dioxygenase large terminal subunit
MIPNQWYAILESNEIKPGKPVGVTRLGEKLVVWRNTKGEVTCMSDLCPHRGVALSAGRLLGDCIECPFHGFQYDTSGRCRIIPANGRNTPVPKAFQVHTYPTREAHDFIWVWWGEPREELPPLPFIEDIDGSFHYSTFRDHWATHYSRAIENQLDVVHLPFIHRTTIGRGNRTLVDGPLATLEADSLCVWVYNRIDDGTKPLKPSEITPPTRPFQLQFLFPNIWQNRISEDIRIVIAFAPIDDENALLYIRFYQRVVRVPVLRGLVNWAGKVGSALIARQDKRVVVTQQPKRSGLHIGEKLIQGDRPIILYRTRREELIGSALSSGQEGLIQK